MSSYLARFSAFVPGLVAPESGDLVTAHLRALDAHEHAGIAASQTHLSNGDDFWSGVGWAARYRPYVVKDGMLMIPVKGVLLHDFPYQLGSFATGYDYIWKAFERGMNDFTVQGIALVIDSPGGEVPGCFDLVDRMYGLRGTKPVRAFAMEHAYSAAYAIASVARKVIVSRTGGVGSVGVVTSHVDVSEAMKNAGVKVTFIHAGRHKVDGNPYEPLPSDVKKRIQARVDATYDVFCSAVARNRGLDIQQIRGTEALTYSAEDAIQVGLADGIGSLDEAMAAFAADLETEQGDDEMTTKQFDQAALDAARAEGLAQGKAESETQMQVVGQTATRHERARITAIVALPEAATRQGAALSLALETDMTAEQAGKVLAKLPEDVKAEAATTEPAPAPQPNAFEAAMNQTGNPNLGAGDGDSEEKDQLASILSDYRSMTGAEPRKTA